ncbi:hypothetical protein BGZ98_001797 [Dissophora globulifera]|uniref:Uncharacterized protein n=1 Tax=Dissophora globulifera TaxID=979702 RepID=A0A9P6RPV7_9FUNG|nr:hypothetical protein BGZ98_001797 [Dissophora globulifera]KAG0323346.1 hypothetical protein BGZ99_002839 [Dissophora globulifera]
MSLSFSRSPPKQSFISRIFSGSSSSSSSSSSRPRKSVSSSAKKSKQPFMSRFRRAPPTTMDKIQAKLHPDPEATPSSIAASKRKAKKVKAKESSRKGKSSFFGRH